ncbi:MAG: MOSC domain-containing protein [Betaproteobacteria bacterium]|nr:MOSC domain-containing protein [Betaproteobacteria bacterium]
MTTRVDHVFIGGLTALDPEGQRTGIYKRPQARAMRVTRLGLDGDHQADLRVHGGPEKAVHHFPAENYEVLANLVPERASEFVPGSIGENLSTRGWTEPRVCIGDVFEAGSCRVQVSQPRTPCWKIDHRFRHPQVSRLVAEHGIAGWYYRVLEEGEVGPGDALELVDRNPDPVSLRELWSVSREHRPEQAALSRIAATPGLSPGWKARLERRLEWLKANA